MGCAVFREKNEPNPREDAEGGESLSQVRRRSIYIISQKVYIFIIISYIYGNDNMMIIVYST